MANSVYCEVNGDIWNGRHHTIIFSVFFQKVSLTYTCHLGKRNWAAWVLYLEIIGSSCLVVIYNIWGVKQVKHHGLKSIVIKHQRTSESLSSDSRVEAQEFLFLISDQVMLIRLNHLNILLRTTSLKAYEFFLLLYFFIGSG